MKKRIRSLLELDQLIMLLILILLCVFFSFAAPTFSTKSNLITLLRQTSQAGIAAIGMMVIILLGGIDISVGSYQGFIGVLVAAILAATDNMWLALCAGLIAGTLIGLLTGTIVTKMKLMPMIVTLGMMTILRGAVLIATSGRSIVISNKAFMQIGKGSLGAVPIPFIIWIVLLFLVWFVLSKTALGRKIYAVGGNHNAAKLAGIPANKITLLAYSFCGFMTALAAVVLAARLSSGQPTAGEGFEMTVIASVVVGGVSMSGGKGSVFGAMIGVIIFSVLTNGLTMLDINSFWQYVIRGTMIIFAVFFDERNKDKMNRNIIKARFSHSEEVKNVE
jgi:ribose transport system permease protein